MTHQKFLNAAKKKFGNKIIIHPLKVSKEDAEKLGLTRTAIQKYPAQAWIALTKDKGYLCPNCDFQLGGIFGSFKWGIQHGYGFCNECKKIEFCYFHYIKKGTAPIQLWAVSGF